MVEPDGRNLVFLLSTPRAGSTLLGAMLGAHRRVFCPPEPWLLLPLEAICSGRAPVLAPYDHELARMAWRHWGDDVLLQRAARAFAHTVYHTLLEETGKEVLVDKTPRYYQCLDWLTALFPKARVIWLKRNPLDVVASYKNTWNVPVLETTGGVLTPNSLDTTVGFDLLATAFLAPSLARHVLRYEDLVTDPTGRMHAVCEFLGIEFEPTMVTYGSDPAQLQRWVDAPLGDKALLSHQRPHPGSVGRWRDALTVTELRTVLLALGRDVFDRLGYRAVLEEAAARAGVHVTDIPERGRLDTLAAMAQEYQGRPTPREQRREQGFLALLEAVSSSRTCRLLRRLGRWEWFDSGMAELAPSPRPVTADSHVPWRGWNRPRSVRGRLGSLLRGERRPAAVSTRVLANSLPKAGTHLLEQTLRAVLRVRDTALHLDQALAGAYDGVDDRGGKIQVGVDGPRLAPTRAVHQALAACPPGAFLSAHLPFSESLARLLAELGYAALLILRDPRDVVVSQAYHMSTRPNHFMHEHYAALPDFGARLMASIVGVQARASRTGRELRSIGERLESLRPWLDHPLNCTISFERLVGPEGGGTTDSQVDEVRAIARHLGMAITITPLETKPIFSRESPTFRRGMIGDWRNHFTAPHADAFKRIAGRWLIELGYESGFDW